jgi:UDP-sulfoquinovose synthase
MSGFFRVSLDQIIFQFYSKNWGLKITDLHQGIVWGTQTAETCLHQDLVNRFDYDGIYGTVLNRFITQVANAIPLTVYGSGGQTRPFIHIADSGKCIQLAIENDVFDCAKVRIFNQVAEVQTIGNIAMMLSRYFNAKIEYLPNPRKEPIENNLKFSNRGLLELGFNPVLLERSLINDVKHIANLTKSQFDPKNVMTSPRW